jgi:DNA-directed RNA polymerase specialized sigma24 family protein
MSKEDLDFEVEEIAQMEGISVTEVEKIIGDACLKLRGQLPIIRQKDIEEKE